jgi:hypothetical protein
MRSVRRRWRFAPIDPRRTTARPGLDLTVVIIVNETRTCLDCVFWHANVLQVVAQRRGRHVEMSCVLSPEDRGRRHDPM